MTEYRYVGRAPQDLSGGRILTMGEYVTLGKDEADDPHNARLIEEGKLMKVSPRAAEKAAADAAAATKSGKDGED